MMSPNGRGYDDTQDTQTGQDYTEWTGTIWDHADSWTDADLLSSDWSVDLWTDPALEQAAGQLAPTQLAQTQSNPTHGGRILMLGVCIHTPVARTFFCCTVCLCTSAHFHACAHTHMAQGCQKGSLHMCHITPSPVSCITHPCCSLTVTSRPFLTLTSTRSCRTPVLKAQGMRISARGREVWLSGQVDPQHRL